MLKRQFLQKNSEQLVQDTRIFRENAVDRWDPIIPELDRYFFIKTVFIYIGGFIHVFMMVPHKKTKKKNKHSVYKLFVHCPA